MDSNITEAIQIMIMGMAVVIIFLIILVCVTKLVSKATAKLDSLLPSEEDTNVTIQTSNNQNDKMIATAIALAHIHNKVK